jgi:hypothetical protein
MDSMDKQQQVHAGLLGGKTIERVEFRLPEEYRTAIIKALGRAAKDPALLSFLDSVETELGVYFVFERNRRQQALLRDQIRMVKKLSASARATLSHLQSLDDATYRVLEQSLNSVNGVGMEILPPSDDTGLPNVKLPRPLHDLTQDLEILSILADSLQTARQKNLKRGAPLKKQRQALIDRIVRTYRDCFGKLPVSTEGSGFVEVLAYCLESVGDTVDDIPSEIKASLNRIRGK